MLAQKQQQQVQGQGSGVTINQPPTVINQQQQAAGDVTPTAAAPAIQQVTGTTSALESAVSSHSYSKRVTN